MTQSPPATPLLVCICAIAMVIVSPARGDRQKEPRFRGGIELINVTATITDDEGRFVGNLSKEDFSSL